MVGKSLFSAAVRSISRSICSPFWVKSVAVSCPDCAQYARDNHPQSVRTPAGEHATLRRAGEKRAVVHLGH